jgi:hypothetical protein
MIWERAVWFSSKYRDPAPELIPRANPATKPTHYFYFHNSQAAYRGNQPGKKGYDQ